MPTGTFGNLSIGGDIEMQSDGTVWLDTAKTMRLFYQSSSLLTYLASPYASMSLSADGVGMSTYPLSGNTGVDFSVGPTTFAVFVADYAGGGPGKILLSADDYTGGHPYSSLELLPNGEMYIQRNPTGKICFFDVTPVVRPTAYTQTYSTADKTHANATSADIGAFTGGVVGFLDAAERDNIRTQFNAVRVDLLDIKQLVNSVIDDLQALGLLQ